MKTRFSWFTVRLASPTSLFPVVQHGKEENLVIVMFFCNDPKAPKYGCDVFLTSLHILQTVHSLYVFRIVVILKLFKYFHYFCKSYCAILKQVLWHRELFFLDEKRLSLMNPHRMGKMTWVMSPICGSPIILFICWSSLFLKPVRFSAFSDSLSQSHWSGSLKSFFSFSHNHSQLIPICSWVSSVIYFIYASFHSLYLW